MSVLQRVAGLSVAKVLSIDKLRFLLSYPIWNYVQEAVVRTRHYEEGLEAGLGMLRFVEEYADELTESERGSIYIRLCLFILKMLDKSDQWEAYIATWDSLRSSTELSITYSADARHFHGSRFEPFIIRDDGRSLRVHFLWVTLHRREIVGRKLAKALAGRPTGNLFHATREDLTAEEVERRLEWIIEVASQAIAREHKHS